MSAPNNVTLGAIVAVIAVLLGFFVLRDIDNSAEGGGGGGGGGTTTTSIVAGSTTTIQLPVSSFVIQVANNSGIAGSAGKLTTQLQLFGYRVQAALNVAPGTVKRARTGVFYLTGFEAQAQQVAALLGSNPEIGPMPTPVPLETGTLKEANILILLGTDMANKDLPGVDGRTGEGAAFTTTTSTSLPG